MESYTFDIIIGYIGHLLNEYLISLVAQRFLKLGIETVCNTKKNRDLPGLTRELKSLFITENLCSLQKLSASAR